MFKLKELTTLLIFRRLLKSVSCHHRSFPFVPPSAISRSVVPISFKRSAVLFFVSTRLTDMQRASIVRCIVALFDCRHVLLGSVSLHRHGVSAHAASDRATAASYSFRAVVNFGSDTYFCARRLRPRLEPGFCIVKLSLRELLQQLTWASAPTRACVRR